MVLGFHHYTRSLGKIDETYIYIKPSDKKAYYVTPDEVTDSVEL